MLWEILKNMAEQKRPSTRALLWAFFIGAISGALLAPKSAKSTWNWLNQQTRGLGSTGRRLANRAGAQVRFRAGQTQGWAHKIKDLFAPEQELLEADDDTIEQRVRVAIGENPLTWDLPRINVNSENGVVTLRGPIQTLREKENLEKVTRRVRGVIDVINKTKLVA